VLFQHVMPFRRHDAKEHVRRELCKYIVENGQLKKQVAQIDALRQQYAELHHRYNVLLELMGEKEEECQDLRAQLRAPASTLKT
jgi:GTP1/Obg family GTP-binding protein